MSYQTSKTAGLLWVSLVYITDEHQKIEGFAAFAALVLAEAEAKLATYGKDTAEYAQLKQDVETLKKSADINDISMRRDMSAAAGNYTKVMTSLQIKQREILPICLRHKLVEFSDGARFDGYGEGL